MAEKVIQEQYSYNKFIERFGRAKGCPRSIRYDYNSSESRRFDFCGTYTMEEANKLAVEGWDTGVKQLELVHGVKIGPGTEFEPDVYGAVVNMGNYLQGLPDNMYRLSAKKDYNLPKLTIYLNGLYDCEVTTKDVLYHSEAVVKLVNELQSKFNVELIMVMSTYQLRGVTLITNIVLKGFNDKLVLNNIAYSFHPSFARRHYFKYLETKPYLSGKGYGHPLGNNTLLTKIREHSKLSNRAILLPEADDAKKGITYSLESCLNVN